MDVTPFLIDDRNPPPEGAHLDGFAWDGTDFVIGDAGLAAFEATGRQLAWCADGRHVLTRREGARIGIGADVIGYRHLFYWAEGTAWAVSESFIDLVAHLRARGVALTEDIAQTGAFLSRKQVFQQLTTDRTAVREIACLDAGARIEIDAGGLRVVPPELPGEGDYAEALHGFLELWLGRIATLQGDPRFTLYFHLSGGIDSRAVTAFHVWLLRHAGLPDRAAIRSLTDARHAGDLEIAEAVAARAGLPLNHIPPRPSRALSPEEALASWQTTSAGAYSPLRIPGDAMHPCDLHFSGHASTGFKRSYSAAAAARALRAMGRAYGYFGRGDRARWRVQMDAHLARLGGGDLGLAWERWQRVNRARFHGGQAASYKTQIAIYHSAAAARVVAMRPREAPAYQFYHDIIAALAPEIFEAAFDDRDKAPGAAVRDRLTAVAPLSPVPGGVWGAITDPGIGAERAPAARDLVGAVLAEVERGWPHLRGRVTPLFRFHLWRLARDLRRGKVRDAVRLRHLHGAWLPIRLAELGVTMEERR
ncbi:hypothetical protein [Roseivivax sediminis]|uniref:Asparagine synthase (Glutamine-hydrolysing) n=1 Tax=Roseivivax sediminis TaxID=936889 RepID=A0A1I2AZP3_9RHOB|nr:hypothetical protein [Roseivivax sediminis]SFE49108.1 hypothetical protein SAMN04515678_110126 [Roseivivax sediminis]